MSPNTKPKGALTTPEMREAMARSTEPVRVIAQLYGVGVRTVYRWRARSVFTDRQRGPRFPSYAFSPAQEKAIVELRCRYLLPLDELLAVTREHINPTASRTGLDRLLARHGVSSLRRVDEWPRRLTIAREIIDWAEGKNGSKNLGA